VGQRPAQPFAYDPQSGMLIAPWQRGELPPGDEPRLCAVLDQIAAFNGALRVPCWIWAEGDRAPGCWPARRRPALADRAVGLGPLVRNLRQVTDPLFRRVGLNLDEP
jgi:hypothetical protein